MDTIAAIATAAGESAVSIIRLSGPSALGIALKAFRKQPMKKICDLKPRLMEFGIIVDEDETILDEVLLVYFKAPYSYTREDVIEIQTHGSRVALERILERVFRLGARPAEKGEFTQRAFLNGRLDLTQAEAIMDLISSRTHQGFDMAIQQLKGKVSERVNQLKAQLKTLMAHIEVCIDYPEEDIEDVTYQEVEKVLIEQGEQMAIIERESQNGKLLKDGIKVVIIGKPNVGKSSLLNALLKENRAIVTDIPGTTRDSIEELMHIKGLPLRLVDTAGLRETEDIIERMGVERSKALFNEADVILLVLNVNEAITDDDIKLFEVILERPVVVILNKIDLEHKLQEEDLISYFESDKIVRTSILNEEGLIDLESTLYHTVIGDTIESQKGIMTNARQLSALKNAKEALEAALNQTRNRVPYEYLMIDFEDAQRYFNEITGDAIDEDILNEIFSTFCLGK